MWQEINAKGRAGVETADWIEDGSALWLEWCEITAPLVEGFHAKASADGAETEG